MARDARHDGERGADSAGRDDRPVIELRDVHRVERDGMIEVRALDGVSLTVAAGELVAVMGPSGSGKTTLLDMVGGLRAPTEGTVRVLGRDIGRASAAESADLRRDAVGYVFQDLNLIPALTAAENVALPLELGGTPAAEALEVAREALDEVGIAQVADRFPHDMSGGQRQRAAIARALIGKRRVLLADEPTGALDSVTGEAVMELLRARVDAGASALLVTHEQRFAAWADRVVYLLDGCIDTRGTRSSLTNGRGAGDHR